MKKEKYIVTGMTCSACSSRVEKAVSKLEGIGKASVNLLTNSMQVEYDETKLNEANIVQAVVDAGYGAERVETGHSSKTKNDSIVGAAAGKAVDTSSAKAKKPEENPAVKAAREAIAEMHHRLMWSDLRFRIFCRIIFTEPIMQSGWLLRNLSWYCLF